VVGLVLGGVVSRLSLREVLQGRSPDGLRYAIEHALTMPWCWPSDPSMAAIARSLVEGAPVEPAIGETILVSVCAEEAREALWRFRWRTRRGERGATFGDGARESLHRVAQLASGVVPHLHSVVATKQLPWTAELICKRGDGLDGKLDDRSFELSMLLALASKLMERPAPVRFAASATIEDNGEIGCVQGLDRKLSMLAENAPAIDTVLVAKDQEAAANELIAQRGWPIRALGVATCRDAIDLVFPAARELPPPHWDDASARGGVVESLIELCRDGASVLDWRAVVRAGEWLQQRDLTARQRARVEVATLIARRHANGSSFEIPWDERLVAHNLAMAAHMVQAAADAGSDSLEAYLRRAEALVVEAEELDDDNRRQLVGAMGRARATLRQYPDALVLLSTATRGWFEGAKVGQSSHALSEWLRVAAIARDGASWEQARGYARAYGNAELPSEDVGRWFVRMALGRGLMTWGQTAEALALLEEGSLDAMPVWLRRSWTRWQAVGRAARSDREGAAALRARLELEDDGEVPIEARFAALDEALEEGRDLSSAIGAIREANPQGVRWLFDQTLTLQEQARRLALEYPY